jgi:hypothetical protein
MLAAHRHTAEFIPITIRNYTIELVLLASGVVVIPLVT